MSAANEKKAIESYENVSEHASKAAGGHSSANPTRTSMFAERLKILGDFKAPAIDTSQLLSYYRRNAETGAALIQIFTQTAQEIARCQGELLRSNAELVLKAPKGIYNQSTSESTASKQTDSAKAILDSNMSSLQEIAEINARSMQEAFDVISKHIAEQVKEVSDVASSATQHAKKKAA